MRIYFVELGRYNSNEIESLSEYKSKDIFYWWILSQEYQYITYIILYIVT